MLRKLNTRRAGFTLVEIMIVVAIIALLAAIAVPNFLRSRKRSQATSILEELRMIDTAIDQYAIENGKSTGSAFNWTDLQKYVKTGTRLYGALSTNSPLDILGNNFYSDGTIDSAHPVTVAQYSWEALSDVAPAAFWSPYNIP